MAPHSRATRSRGIQGRVSGTKLGEPREEEGTPSTQVSVAARGPKPGLQRCRHLAVAMERPGSRTFHGGSITWGRWGARERPSGPHTPALCTLACCQDSMGATALQETKSKAGSALRGLAHPHGCRLLSTRRPGERVLSFGSKPSVSVLSSQPCDPG